MFAPAILPLAPVRRRLHHKGNSACSIRCLADPPAERVVLEVAPGPGL